MKDKLYRTGLRIEKIDEGEGYESKLVEQIELATFHTIEEILTYRYELSQNYSQKLLVYPRCSIKSPHLRLSLPGIE